MLNIALVVPALDTGGLEEVAFNLFREYKASGHRCIFLVESDKCGEIADRLCHNDFVIFNGRPNIFLNACLEQSIDIIHYHYSVFMIKEAKSLGLKCIYTIHNYYTWLRDSDFVDRANKIYLADSIIAVSAGVADYFCARSNIHRSAVEVIPNGINYARFANEDVSLSRADLGISSSAYVFANIASFHQVKHQDLIVRAAASLSKRRSDFTVTFIGGVGETDYATHVHELIHSLGVDNFVKVAGHIPGDAMASVYKGVADCILLPSIIEGNSNVVLEALYFSKPLILTDVGFAREAGKHSSGVQVIPPAYNDMMHLGPEQIKQISRASDVPNLEALVVAMERAIDNGRPERQNAENGRRIAGLSSADMGKAYLRLPAIESARHLVQSKEQ